MDAVYVIKNGEKKLVASTANQKRPMTYHKCNIALNKAGTLEIDLPISNPMRGEITASDEITYERNGIEIFGGRVKEERKNILNTGRITATGYLDYLNDINMEPYEWQGDVRGFLETLMNHYNMHKEESRQILLGSVTVTDQNNYIHRSSTKRKKILEIINDALIDKLGGYIRVRVQSGIKYLDYISDFGRESGQIIEYGSNLLELANTVSYKDVYSVIIPEGKEDEDGNRLNIKSVNDDSIYIINSAAIDRIGWKEIVIQWDDVTLPENLKTKAEALSEEYANPVRTLEVKAVDLSFDGKHDRWHLGDIIHSKSAYHNLDIKLMLTDVTYYALTREEERMTLGSSAKTYTEQTASNIRKLENDSDTVKRYNANLSERISNASGLYSTVETKEDGTQIIWSHDKPEKNESMIIMTFNSEGMFMTNDGGATWYGQSFDGEFLANLINAYDISADNIHGGTLSSIDVGEDGMPNFYIDMNTGDVAKLGYIGLVRRESGNMSLKWMG